MLRTKLVVIFLMAVLSIQLLPFRQMTRMLLSGTMTEEIVHGNDVAKNCGPDEVVKHFLPGPAIQVTDLLYFAAGSLRHDAEALIHRHADDIPTPPPNC